MYFFQKIFSEWKLCLTNIVDYSSMNYLILNAVNFFCEWCNVRSRNQNDLNEHIAGEKHQSKAYTKKKNLPVQNGPQDGATANATASSSRKKHKDKAKKAAIWSR